MNGMNSSTPVKSASRDEWQVLIIGGGIAGLSGAIYLTRAMHRTLLIDSGDSMARWEPHVENYLGFPDSISGEELLRRGRAQASRFGMEIVEDLIEKLELSDGLFRATSKRQSWKARRVLLATGIYHLPPDIEGVTDCLGHSMFFCKDCDGHRVWGKRIAIYGSGNEAARYAIAMLSYSPHVSLLTNGKTPQWDAPHAGWLKDYSIPVHSGRILRVSREGWQLRSLTLTDGKELEFDALFTTRGDIYFNRLARMVGAEVNAEGEVEVDACLQTTVPGLYAAGCVTPANCQMIIAAGQGAIAAQAINRDLFDESLKTGQLRKFSAGHGEAHPESSPASLSPETSSIR
jgi:thioredoxin reductase (NADPH)